MKVVSNDDGSLSLLGSDIELYDLIWEAKAWNAKAAKENERNGFPAGKQFITADAKYQSLLDELVPLMKK